MVITILKRRLDFISLFIVELSKKVKLYSLARACEGPSKVGSCVSTFCGAFPRVLALDLSN